MVFDEKKVIVIILMVISLGCVIYGALIFKRLHTPYIAKTSVKDGHMEAWCKTEGIARMLLGIDISFLAMYNMGGVMARAGLFLFVMMMVFITSMRYKNNGDHFKK